MKTPNEELAGGSACPTWTKPWGRRFLLPTLRRKDWCLQRSATDTGLAQNFHQQHPGVHHARHHREQKAWRQPVQSSRRIAQQQYAGDEERHIGELRLDDPHNAPMSRVTGLAVQVS